MAGLFRSPDEAQQAYAAPLRLGACFGLRAFGGDDRDLPRLGGITPQFPGTMLNSFERRIFAVVHQKMPQLGDGVAVAADIGGRTAP